LDFYNIYGLIITTNFYMLIIRRMFVKLIKNFNNKLDIIKLLVNYPIQGMELLIRDPKHVKMVGVH
jgi:hypothetical protein